MDRPGGIGSPLGCCLGFPDDRDMYCVDPPGGHGIGGLARRRWTTPLHARAIDGDGWAGGIREKEWSVKQGAAESRGALDRRTLKKILDNSFDEIFVTDGRGTIIYVNETCRRNYGLEPEEVIGKKGWELFEQGYCDVPVTEVVIESREPYSIEQRTNTGQRILTTATPVFDASGRIELIIQNVRDITQLESIKRELKDTKRLLRRYEKEVKELRSKSFGSAGIIAHSNPMRKIMHLGLRVAPTDASVLILGESGTGKGLFAKFLHNESTRKNGAFVTINCAAIPENLMESELFGYERGAFSGAEKEGKVGLIELAHQGTIFFDEIGEMPLGLQAKLLEVIQEKTFKRVGGIQSRHVDIRIISATNRHLAQMVGEGRFRDDLYFRLNVIEVVMPPLRERREDLSALVHFFLNRHDEKYGTRHQMSRQSMDRLFAHRWPGNVRELDHLAERLVLTVDEPVIAPEHLPAAFHRSRQPDPWHILEQSESLEQTLEEIKRQLVTRAFEKMKSSYKVANALKISQSKASRLIRRYIPRASGEPSGGPS